MAAVAEALGTAGASPDDEQLAALTLCSRGAPIDAVSKSLTWRDFEHFCSNVMRAKGYRVRENINLKKPRAQVDVLGISERLSLAVDCKHWKRSSGAVALARLVEAQKGRARRLHDSLEPIGPVAAVILTMVDPGLRFVDGGAIVPIFTFGDFLDRIEDHSESLERV